MRRDPVRVVDDTHLWELLVEAMFKDVAALPAALAAALNRTAAVDSKVVESTGPSGLVFKSERKVDLPASTVEALVSALLPYVPNPGHERMLLRAYST